MGLEVEERVPISRTPEMIVLGEQDSELNFEAEFSKDQMSLNKY